MYSIKGNISNEIAIKNSKFIALIYKLNDNNINILLDEAKEKYPKATHYCYGYIYDSIKHSSDDNEPTGTAGQPILNVLEKEKLNHILVIVVRYFGGIKLGAGGLIRAYTKAVTETLKQAEIIELEEGYKIELTYNYDNQNDINYILQNSIILKEEYLETIKIEALVNKDTFNKLSKYNPILIEETYIEKKQH